ncbi:hypothetical protein [Streptomyces sp. MP131-18]|uniref:hypothetical protein n=1 Tax=Streptomyces sp. MP131-18 TaxID=1857892 RepID=UPI00097C177E|nr:hypothetical protein [Streptomyces sp. MP131-18]ONK13159.1 hypothetical protein STBA_39210 [Streptomyces sp. MP131-18]
MTDHDSGDLGIGGIDIALNCRTWVPSEIELRLGNRHAQEIMALQERVRPDMPTQDTERLWTTQLIVYSASVVTMTDRLLVQENSGVPAESPMVRLLRAYANAGRPLVQFAPRLEEAWEAAPVPEPSDEEIAEEAAQFALSADRACGWLIQKNVQRWEEVHLPSGAMELWRTVSHRMMVIGGVITAAITGDLDW